MPSTATMVSRFAHHGLAVNSKPPEPGPVSSTRSSSSLIDNEYDAGKDRVREALTDVAAPNSP